MALLLILLILSFVLAPLAGCKSKEELLKAAEEEGRLLAEKKARMAKGVGEALKDEGAAAAEALGEGTGKVLDGVGRGLEKGLEAVEISTSDALLESKLHAERAGRHREGDAPAIKVYVVLEAPFKGTLSLVGRDGEGKEVGRSKVDLDEASATGKYVVFTFDKLTDLTQAKRFELASTASAPKPAPAPAPAKPSP